MQNARYRSLNYIYSGVILPDQKFCRIVSDIFSSLYLIFYLEVLLVIICTRLKKIFLISTIVKSQLYDFSLNPSRNMQPNSFTSIYIYIDQQIQILMDILVKMGVQAMNYFLSAIVYLLPSYLAKKKVLVVGEPFFPNDESSHLEI